MKVQDVEGKPYLDSLVNTAKRGKHHRHKTQWNTGKTKNEKVVEMDVQKVKETKGIC